ncbi:MAG: epoxyqueuosine reductase QueH [Tissierellia bacterium]|nr:epoxyqueuosine reductase QueH [Tissierellia bacterium]
MNENYQIVLDREIEGILKRGATPKLLLHSCCGPCSSYVIEYLSKYFEIMILFYNPNIYPKSEYIKRADEQEKIIRNLKTINKVDFSIEDYIPEKYYQRIVGLEEEREGGLRCTECFELRMRYAAGYAKDRGFDYFTTTLSVSPYKNSKLLNKLGHDLEIEFGINYLYSDFKKRNGYKRSIELSREYDLYRQEYCGCEFSLSEAIERQKRAGE